MIAAGCVSTKKNLRRNIMNLFSFLLVNFVSTTIGGTYTISLVPQAGTAMNQPSTASSSIEGMFSCMSLRI
jgi:hypothetical protein